MKKITLIASLLALCAFVAPVHAQTEVMAWGNLTGIRIDGQLIEFETSFRIVEKDWTSMFASGRERANTTFVREDGKAIVRSGAERIRYEETVADPEKGKAVVTLTYQSDTTRRIEGFYYAFTFPKQRYANADIKISGKRIDVKAPGRNVQ
ncbi:MAG: hypothetical protein LBM61_05350, partial [Prevotellaceae bacterium]|nr:hypothetical protein [Prevotellaceae bacterium]